MNDKKYSISKSSFLKLEQCSKSFFLYKNHPYLRDKLSIDKRLTFQRGHDIGYFAQQLFPEGIDVSKETNNAGEAYELTKKLLQDKKPVIYEATFIHEGVLVMLDILVFDGEKYHAYEVKSSIKVSETYLRDACLQYYVLKNSLPSFEDLFLVTINGEYVFEKEIEPKKYFKKRSVKNEAEKNLVYFEEKIKEAYFILEQNLIPNIAIGKHCFRPYQCDFFQTCWKGRLHEKSIFNLPLISKDKLFEWHEQGFAAIDELKDDLFENEKHLRIKKSFAGQEPIINIENIKKLLSGIELPAAALDMEIWSSAVPQLEGTRPFQQIPFLFCMTDGLKENHFISRHATDERKRFAEELIQQTSPYKTIIVYDKTMEELAINGLKENCPELSGELDILKTKLKDLFDIIKNLYFYDPAFKNNFSLKVVSDVLNTGVTYTDIQSGLEAMNYYEKYRSESNVIEDKLLEEKLINYCMNDASATLKLWQYLENLIK